ncbi:glycosyltransferase [Cohnella yongneupensis]|uniref:Glycosyltransferase n=1 Tax=Cohnella yongneupensis TaxID=425006 RepID=A0ABW0R7M3_9BACL
MGKSPTISLCMIVRNEEESLGRCLESVKGIADEIIIVDTGSNDRTKEIALQYGAKVYDFVWIDHFAAARNYAFSLATQQYQLWLDADDVFESADRAKLLELKKRLDPSVDSVTMLYHLAFDASGNPSSSLRRNRLVRRERQFQWIGPVHEYLAVSGNFMHSDIAVTHRKERAFTDRNLRIYRKRQAEDESFSQRDLYYFANELKDHKHYEEAIQYYEKFLDSEGIWVEDAVSACVKLADCFGSLGRKDDRLRALCRSFAYDAPRSEPCALIGDSWLDRKQYEQAIFWYELATKREPSEQTMGMRNRYASTWYPHLQMCVCYDRLGRLDEAYRHNEIAISYWPDHPSMLFNRRYFATRLKGSNGDAESVLG